jgi:hypothetical protein
MDIAPSASLGRSSDSVSLKRSAERLYIHIYIYI